MTLDVLKIVDFPDIHGRSFWKNTVTQYKDNPEYGFIFSGDYFDPYPTIDNITEDMALENWYALYEEMWDHPRTIWLLGNHDWHYLPWLKDSYGCRRSYRYFDTISEIFQNNFDKFNIAYEHTINGKKFLFTHAGVLTGWARYVYSTVNPEIYEHILNPYNESDLQEIESQNNDIYNNYIDFIYNADFLNSLKNDEKYRWLLWQIGYSRGGDDIDGSCLWADVNDHMDIEFIMNMPEFKSHNIFQVFGHSYSKRELITSNFAMLDCKTPFQIDCNTGEIIKLE